MNVIVGVSAHYHDAACCVLRDGALIAASQEERFSRIKHDPGLPVRAFRYCLEAAEVGIEDITCIAYYEDPVVKAGRQILAAGPRLLTDPSLRYRIDPGRVATDVKELFGYEGRIEYVEHHLSHAASAFHCSGFEEAAVLTVDGVGEWTTSSYGKGNPGELCLLERVDYPHSVGLLYSTITSYLGFKVNSGEYKVMGLASYGKPRYVDEIRALVQTPSAGGLRLDLRYFDFLNTERMYTDKLVQLLGHGPRKAGEPLTTFHEDLARSTQFVLEETLLSMVRHLHDLCPSNRLCYAGGVALNCVANMRILSDGPFGELFVQPAAGDAGGAIGAAQVACSRMGTRPERKRLTHVFLGPVEPQRTTDYRLEASSVGRARRFGEDLESLVREAARRLADGCVLGWVQGRSEFGPRALGARSILADPRRPEMKDRVNGTVKRRESFRPFAPAVLESEAARYFDLDHPSPFMTTTAKVRPEASLPAVTHVDGTARVQTVTERAHPIFFRLLTAFHELTGCPVLLNTSFNMRGEPIVQDSIDALSTLALCDVDVLVVGSTLLERGVQGSAWSELDEMAKARRAKHGSTLPATVYTFI